MERYIDIIFYEGNGHMTISLDEFLPASKPRLRKLLKVIDEDYGHRDGLRAAIIRYCDGRAAELLGSRKAIADRAVRHLAQAGAMQVEIDRLSSEVRAMQEYVRAHCRPGSSYHGQLKALRAQLKAKKDAQRSALSVHRDCKRLSDRALRDAEKLREDKEVVSHGR